jgi:hypothetical protein
MGGTMMQTRANKTSTPEEMRVWGEMKQGTACATVIVPTHGTTFIPQNGTSGAPTVIIYPLTSSLSTTNLQSMTLGSFSDPT